MALKAAAPPSVFIVYIALYLIFCILKTCVNTDESSHVFCVPGNEGEYFWKNLYQFSLFTKYNEVTMCYNMLVLQKL